MQRQLSDVFNSYMEYTDDSEPTALFRKWCALNAITSAVRRRVWYPMAHDQIYPNMFILLVGDPAARKSTALGQLRSVLEPLRERNPAFDISPDKVTSEALLVRLQKKGKDPIASMHPESPTMHSASSSVIASEFSVFLQKQSDEFIATLCDIYDSPNYWEYLTKTQGHFEIHGICLNMIGGITPELIKTFMPEVAISGGFASRIVFVYGEAKEKHIAFPEFTDKQKGMRDAIIDDLQYISENITGPFTMTDEWKERYEEFYKSCEILPPELKHKNLHTYGNRRQIHLIKTCMAFSLSKGDSLCLDGEDFIRAYDLLRETEQYMAYCFMGFGKNPINIYLKEFYDVMYEYGDKEVHKMVVYDHFVNDVPLPIFDEIIDTCVQQGGVLKKTVVEKGQIQTYLTYNKNYKRKSVPTLQLGGQHQGSSDESPHSESVEASGS